MPRPDRTLHEFWPPPQPALSVWNVAKVKGALAAHERGDFQASSLLAQAMDRSPRIFAALNTRILAVLGLPFSVKPSAANKQRGGPIAARFATAWPRVAPKRVLSQLLRWELTLGVALAEQIYETRGPDGWVPRLRPVHAFHVRWHEALERWQVQTKAGLVTIEPGDPHWVLFTRTAEQPWMGGLVRVLGLEDSLRNYAIRDWGRRSEKHGLPLALAKVPAQASDADKDRFFDDVSNLGTESTVLAAQGATDQESFDIELIEVADSKGELFSALLDKVDSDVAIATLGQNLSTEVKGGSFAAAKAHERVRADYLEADAGLIDETLCEQVARPWAAYNFGDSRLAPEPFHDPAPPEDQSAKATTLNTLGDALAKLAAAGVDTGPVIDAFGLKRAPESAAPALPADGAADEPTTDEAA
jgi:phage gp29-like protein